MDGDPSERIKCTMANWTGIAYKIPRTALDKCKDMDILKQSGVYFLFGTDKEDNTVIYIGQAGIRKNGKGLLLRVQESHTSIDYWTEVVMFTTTNNSFGPTEISYLENRFCNLALEAKRYSVKNITPSGIYTPECLEFCVKRIGVDRIMFSIDYPFATAQGKEAILEAPFLSEEDKEKIAHLNAERLLKLK